MGGLRRARSTTTTGSICRCIIIIGARCRVRRVRRLRRVTRVSGDVWDYQTHLGLTIDTTFVT